MSGSIVKSSRAPLAVAAALLLSGSLLAQPVVNGSKPVLLKHFTAAERNGGDGQEVFDIYDLGDGVYVLGGTHNCGLIVGSRGAIVVDTRLRVDFPIVSGEIAKLTKQPVRYVISTHYHPDHVGSNELFRLRGAEIVGNANLAARMLAPPELNPHTGKPIDPAPKLALPTITYTDRMTLDIGGVVVEIIHPKSAHTDNDSIVYLPGKNVIFTGDVAMMSYAPPDITSGGSLDGLIKTADMIISMSNDQTRIVPGHFRIMSKADVIDFRNMLVTSRDRIARAKAKGMTEDQVVAANLLADLDGKWMGIGGPVIKTFPRIVYRSVP